MIYVTGDTHMPQDLAKLDEWNFPQQAGLTKDDYVIVAGDFGGLWRDDEESRERLDALNGANYTLLWVDGNHENFDLLSMYPISEWNGGKVHMIRPSVIHLMRGQVYTIDGQTFFTMGGAYSIDKPWRVPFVSWWPQEMPSVEEYEEAIQNLEKQNYNVDYVITHTAKTSIVKDHYIANINCEQELNDFFEKLDNVLTYKHWYFGHIHKDADIDEKHTLLYKRVVEIK